MKKYNGEKAVISLTTWKARINTVHKTIANLVGMCPGFHIVLVLSEEEFPKKEAELPNSLMQFVDLDLIEILWVYKNYRSFKKVLFTIDKYKDIPVISADDDCLYQRNYAEELYQEWTKHKNSVITYRAVIYKNIVFSHGPSTLFPPNCFNIYINKLLTNRVLYTNHDDIFYGLLLQKNHIAIYNIFDKIPYTFHDSIQALSQRKTMLCQDAIDFIKKELSFI